MQHIYIGCIIEKRTNRTRHLILFIRFASTLKCSCFPEEGSCSLSSSCWSSQAPEAAWSRAAGEAPALCLQDVPLPCGQWQQPLPKHVTLNALPLGSFHQGGILLFHKLLLETAPLSSCPANPACCQAHQAVCPIPLPAKDNSDHFHHLLSRTLVGWWALASALFRRRCYHTIDSISWVWRWKQVGNLSHGELQYLDQKEMMLWSSSGTPSPPSSSQFMQAIFITLPVGDK